MDTWLFYIMGVAYKTSLELLVDGEVVDTKTVSRRFDAPGLERLEIAEKGVVGTYYKTSMENAVIGSTKQPPMVDQRDYSVRSIAKRWNSTSDG